jgi:hypothetical protein
MMRNIAVQSAFQIALLAYLLLLAFRDFGCEAGSARHYTVLFNTFVFCQIFNEFNARSIGDELDVFKGLERNATFVGIIAFTVIAQVGIVQYGGDFVKTVPLPLEDWKRCVLMAALSLPLGGLMRLLPVSENEANFAVLPAILRGKGKTAADASEEGGASTNNQLTPTFILWGLVVAVIPGLVYQEFNGQWARHFVAFVAFLGQLQADGAALPPIARPIVAALHGALDGLVLAPQ